MFKLIKNVTKMDEIHRILTLSYNWNQILLMDLKWMGFIIQKVKKRSKEPPVKIKGVELLSFIVAPH